MPETVLAKIFQRANCTQLILDTCHASYGCKCSGLPPTPGQWPRYIREAIALS